MTASRGTSTGSQLVIHRARVILSLVQHDGSYCQSIRDANHVSFAHHVSQETLILAKDQNVIHRHESLLEISHTEPLQYLIPRTYFWLKSRSSPRTISIGLSFFYVLHRERLTHLRFTIFKTVMSLSTSDMSMTYGTKNMIVFPLTFLWTQDLSKFLLLGNRHAYKAAENKNFKTYKAISFPIDPLYGSVLV